MKNVLIAFEASGTVCKAFRKRGYNAFSLDILKTYGDLPQYHIVGNAFNYIDHGGYFKTETGVCYFVDEWDLVIMHPPCTYLTNANNRWYNAARYGKKALDRMIFRYCAIADFLACTECTAKRWAIENPVGIMSTKYRKPDQIYNPYNFKGETECKRTCLWLHNLPPLEYTQDVPTEERTHNIFKGYLNGVQYAWNDKRVAVFRAKTPEGVAEAMSEQWGQIL